MSDEIVLSIPEACGRARCGRTFLYGAIGRGELRAFKRGARTFIFVSDLDAWLGSLPQLKPGSKIVIGRKRAGGA